MALPGSYFVPNLGLDPYYGAPPDAYPNLDPATGQPLPPEQIAYVQSQQAGQPPPPGSAPPQYLVDQGYQPVQGPDYAAIARAVEEEQRRVWEGIRILGEQFESNRAEIRAKMDELRQAAANNPLGIDPEMYTRQMRKYKTELEDLDKRQKRATRQVINRKGMRDPFAGQRTSDPFDQLPSLIQSLDVTANDLTNERNRLEASGGSQEDIDNFNRRIDAFNAELDRVQGLANLQQYLYSQALANPAKGLKKGSPAATIADFQRKAGLAVTGKYDAITQEAFMRAQAYAAAQPKSREARDLRQYLHNPNEYLAQQRRQASSAREQLRRVAEVLSLTNKDVNRLTSKGRDTSTEVFAREEYVKRLGADNRKDALAAINKALKADVTDQQVIQVAKNVRAALNAKKPGGIGSGVLAGIGSAFETIFEPLQRAYYAAKYGEGKGEDLGTQLRAMLGALPGLGFTAGSSEDSSARRLIEATNTREERERLRNKGQLASFGEYVTGGAEDVLKGKALERYRKNANFGLGLGPKADWLSAPVDVAFQVSTDPTLGLSLGLHGIAKPTAFLGREAADAAARAAEAAGIREGLSRGLSDAALQLIRQRAFGGAVDGFLSSGTGRTLLESIDRAIANEPLHDLAAVQKVFRGMGAVDAIKVAEMARTADNAAVREAVLESLRTGRWTPKIRPLTSQLPAGLGLRQENIGRSAVASSRTGGRLVRQVAREGTERAATFTRNPVQWASRAIDSTLAKAERGLKTRGEFEARWIEQAHPTQRAYGVMNEVRTTTDSAFQAFAEQRLRPFLITKDGFLGMGRGRVPRAVFAEAARRGGADFEAALREVETVKALLDGKAGQAAGRHMRTELEQGFRAEASKFRSLVSVSTHNAGVEIEKGGKYTVKDLRGLINRIDVNSPLRARAEAALAGATENAQRNALGRQLKTLIENPRARLQAERISMTEDARLATQQASELEMTKRLGGKGVLAGAGRAALAITEPGMPGRLAFEPHASWAVNVTQRVDAIDRIAQGFELSDVQRAALRAEAESIKTEDDLFKLAMKPMRIAARDANVDSRIVEELIRGARSDYSRQLGFGVNQLTGELTGDIQTLAQRVESIPVVGPDDLRNAINGELARQGNVGAKLRAGVSRSGDIQIFGLEKGGRPFTVKMSLEAGHRFWKFLIVTNLHLPLVGALAGTVAALTGVGSPEDIAIGAAIGLAGPVRYIARVAGIEENFRKVLTRGFKPQEYVPVVSKWMAERGISPEWRFADYSAVRSSGHIGSEFETRFLLSPTRDWQALRPGQRGFEEGWLRTVQHHLQPDVYTVDRILLGERAGRLTTEEANELLKQLKNTDEGRLWLRRFKRGEGGPRNWSDAVKRVRGQVNTYTDAELAGARLDGEVAIEDLKGRTPPQFVYAQKKGSVRAATLWRNYNDVTSRMVFSGATNRMNRNPMARWEYAEQFDFLTRIGVDPERAQNIAAERAVAHTNEVMFRIDAESRFARKIDYIFPFQQPREEFVRVWSKLVAGEPTRVMRVTRLGALAFNNGKSMGIFRKDEYTGEWEMSVPGSAYLSKVLTGTNARFDVNLGDLFFVAQGGVFGVSAIPTPGGPYWTVISRQLTNEFPDLFQRDNLLTKWLMPFGPGRDLFRPESRRLWIGLAGSTPPWAFVDDETMEGEFEKAKIQVARGLYADKVRAGASPDEAWPTDEEVINATKDFFKLWAFMGSVTPATPRPVYIDQEMYQRIRDRMTLGGKVDFDYADFTKRYPELTPYLLPTTEWVGPDDYGLWKNPLDAAKELSLRYRETVKYDDFKADFKQYQKEQAAYRTRAQLFAMPSSPERDQALLAWSLDNPKLASRTRETYFRDRDLAKILTTTPKGGERDRAINAWRLRYNVSRQSYGRIKSRAMAFAPNPWAAARDTGHILREVNRRVQHGENEVDVVGRLNPAEQVRYWDWKRSELSVNWNPYQDPQTVMDRYNYYRKLKNAVMSNNPILTAFFADRNNNFDQYVQELRGKQNETVSAIYEEINQVTEAMDQAAKAKQWDTYYQLKNKQQTLYDMKRAVVNDLYERFPQLSDAWDDITALSLAAESGNLKKYQQLQSRLERDVKTASTKFVPTNDQLYYDSLPENIKRAYIANLTDRLAAPEIPKAPKGAGDSYYQDIAEVKGYLKQQQVSKLYWDTLTDFQQDLLSLNLPADMVRGWALESYLTQEQYRKGTEFARSRGYAGGLASGEPFDGNPLLKYAWETLQRYDQRGGVHAPKAYETYLELPPDPVVRAEFLQRHPDVQAYLEAGGFYNAPPEDQAIIQRIMLRYAPEGSAGYQRNGSFRRGFTRYGGGRRSPNVYDENGHFLGRMLRSGEFRPLDVDFAFEQFRVYNRRAEGALAPETYNLWLNMPRGAEKSEFLKQHPEVQDWIRLGPMANMPEEYQQVVRDIMIRYGYWTQQQDPLGDLINEYYRTPAYARSEWLKQHPELMAYWNSLKSPEELAMSELADHYFSIQDGTARKAFLMAHPELGKYFVQQRNRRYQRFLTQVAIFMGQNPDLFDSYLKQQTETLNELLRRFGESAFMREQVPTPRGDSGGGRIRDSGTRRRPRNT